MSVLARATSNMDDLLAVKQEMVDRELILRGVFEDEIKRLEAARDELTQRMGAIQSIEEANHFRDTWEATAAKGQIDSAALVAKAQTVLSEANSKAGAIKDAQDGAMALSREAASALEDYTTRKAQLEAQYSAKDADLAKREAILRDAREQLNADQGALNARAAKIEAKAALLSEKV